MSELQQTFAEIESDISDKKEYAMAISKLENIILTDPNNAEANYLMGSAYRRQQKWDSATNYLIRSLIINPQNRLCAIDLEYCAKVQSELLGTEKLPQYFEMVPNSSSFFWFRGLLFYLMGQYRNAIKEYSKAVEISPKDEDLYHMIAKCYNKNGECDKAVVEYENYLKIYANNEASNIYIEIAFMFIKNNRFNDALLFFDKFVNIAYDIPENDMGMLCLPFSREDFHEPDKICAGVLNSAPENWSAFACKVILELIAVNIKEK